MGKRQVLISHPTKWALKFDGVNSVKEWRKLHTKLAKEANRELVAEKEQKIRALEKKILGLDVESDESRLARLEMRELREIVADLKKMPPLRAREAMRMGW